jgi:hydroxymethylpyrimidine/phosphomethylpyrimidine kinase
MEPAGLEVFKRTLMKLATLVTPNVAEAQALSGVEIRSLDDAETAGRALLEAGARSVLVTGGHLPRGPVTDLLIRPEGTVSFEGSRVDSVHTHGTGCILASAIATRLALGAGLVEAVDWAKHYVGEAIRHGFAPGRGPGQVDPLFAMRHKDGDATGRSRDVG